MICGVGQGALKPFLVAVHGLRKGWSVIDGLKFYVSIVSISLEIWLLIVPNSLNIWVLMAYIDFEILFFQLGPLV